MHASELIKRASEEAGRVAMVIVLDARGSAPRHPGSRMLVYADGRTLGTVGGGPVEAKAVEAAAELAASGGAVRLTVELTGERAVGNQPICGGSVSLAAFRVPDATAYAAAAALLEGGERALLVVSPDDGRCRAVVGSGGRAAYGDGFPLDGAAVRSALETRSPIISAEDGLLYDPVEPPDRLLILGGGHVGQALARFASELEFRVCVADERPEYAAPARFPAGTETRVGRYADIVAGYPFGPGAYAVVVSPSHSTDLECVRAVLKREYRYAGFIGSRRKTRMIMDQAVADGFPADKVEALRAPIGADIGAETPAEIAVAVLAEIIAVRRDSPAIRAMDADRARRRA